MGTISKIFNRFVNEYLDSRIVFVIDLLISVFASFVIFFVLLSVDIPLYHSGEFALIWFVSAIFGTLAGMFIFRSYRVVIRHTNLKDYAKFGLVAIFKVAFVGIILTVTGYMRMTMGFILACDLLLTFFFFICFRVMVVFAYDIYREKVGEMSRRMRILVYGTSDKSVSAYTRFSESPHYKVVGFIAEDGQVTNVSMFNKPVLAALDESEFTETIERMAVQGILFPSEKIASSQKDGFIPFCLSHNIKPLIVPTVEEASGGKIMKSRIREVKIEDLLGRDEIMISIGEIRENFSNKVVMVTGAAGSIGSELCRQLAGFGVRKLVLFDNAETPMHNIRLELEERYPTLDFVPIIGDVRHPERLDFAFRAHHPQVVFHAAAYKHVPLMEENPCEAVMVNVSGTRNVADKCIEYDVEKMVMISTDKAVNPTNIMGCTKRLAEIYVQSLGLSIEKGEHPGKTKFVTTRFGNVLGSNGSVIPRFRDQIEKGGPVTVTHPDITRFFMTIPEACRLVLEAATKSEGNQIFVFDMGESVKIADLAKKMIYLAGLKLGEDIDIMYTGLRPGEKLYEEVLSNKENTSPSFHERIRIAKVREYSYADALESNLKLSRLAVSVDIPEMVRLMKKVVPEFKSRNSRFEAYDKEQEAGN